MKEYFDSFIKENKEFAEPFARLHDCILAGNNSVSSHIVSQTLVIDDNWVAPIQEAILSIEKIVKNPKTFIKTEREVLPADRTKKVDGETIRYLARHTADINEIDEAGNVRPKRLNSGVTDVEIGIYENRVVYALILRIENFLRRTSKEIENRINTIDSTTLAVKSLYAVDDAKFDCNLTLRMDKESANKIVLANNQKLLAAIKEMSSRIKQIKRTQFFKELSMHKKVTPPLNKTNLFQMNYDYKICYECWGLLSANNEIDCKLEVSTAPLPLLNPYYNDISYLVMGATLTFVYNSGSQKGAVEQVRDKKRKAVRKFKVSRSVSYEPLAPHFSPAEPQELINQYYFEKMTELLGASQGAEEGKEKLSSKQLLALKFNGVFSKVRRIDMALYEDALGLSFKEEIKSGSMLERKKALVARESERLDKYQTILNYLRRDLALEERKQSTRTKYLEEEKEKLALLQAKEDALEKQRAEKLAQEQRLKELAEEKAKEEQRIKEEKQRLKEEKEREKQRLKEQREKAKEAAKLEKERLAKEAAAKAQEKKLAKKLAQEEAEKAAKTQAEAKVQEKAGVDPQEVKAAKPQRAAAQTAKSIQNAQSDVSHSLNEGNSSDDTFLQADNADIPIVSVQDEIKKTAAGIVDAIKGQDEMFLNSSDGAHYIDKDNAAEDGGALSDIAAPDNLIVYQISNADSNNPQDAERAAMGADAYTDTEMGDGEDSAIADEDSESFKRDADIAYGAYEKNETIDKSVADTYGGNNSNTVDNNDDSNNADAVDNNADGNTHTDGAEAYAAAGDTESGDASDIEDPLFTFWEQGGFQSERLSRGQLRAANRQAKREAAEQAKLEKAEFDKKERRIKASLSKTDFLAEQIRLNEEELIKERLRINEIKKALSQTRQDSGGKKFTQKETFQLYRHYRRLYFEMALKINSANEREDSIAKLEEIRKVNLAGKKK